MPDKGTALDVENRVTQLREWESAAQHDVDQLSAEVARVQQRLNAAREQVDLLGRLIRLSEHGADDSSTKEGSIASDWSVRGDLESHVEQILDSSGEPMHISDIRRALLDRGVPLPGRGDASNIIVRLSRAPETFTRTARGTYGLASWGLTPMPKRNRKK